MIIVDCRTGSIELAPKLRHIGAYVVEDILESADFAFEGWTAKGRGAIGVERKTVGDMLTCMTDGRFVEGQLPRMLNDYHELWLVVEGIWYEDKNDGSLTYKQGYQERTTRIHYTAMDKYLYSIMRIAGVNVIQTSGPEQTCRRILDLYQHAQKGMDEHSTFRGFRTDCDVTDTLKSAKPLVMLWAKELPGVGWLRASKFSGVFNSGLELANATAGDFQKIEGISRKMALEYWRKIRGR